MVAEQKFLIRIKPELRQLRARAEAAPPLPLPAAAPARLVQGASPSAIVTAGGDASARVGTRPPPRPIRLRRDGLRPLCVEAVPVLVLPLEPGPVSPGRGEERREATSVGCSVGPQERGHLALYLDPEDRLVAHIREPRDDTRRPAFRAAWITNQSDLRALLGTARPDGCATLPAAPRGPEDARPRTRPWDSGPDPVTRARAAGPTRQEE